MVDPDDLTRALADVPETVIEATTVLYRIHRSINGPIHFSRDATGRFDPVTAARSEFGTCYLGEQPLTAFVEVFGRTATISETAINERVLTEVVLARDLRVADLTARSMLGLVGSFPYVSVGPEYGDSQRWAYALHSLGFDGIRYSASHDPAFKCVSLAVFSDAEDALASNKSTPIPDDLIELAEDEFSLMVFPTA